MSSRLDDRIRTLMQQVVDESPPPPDLPTGPPPAPVPAWRLPNWAVAVGAAIAVFVLIGGFVWLVSGTESDIVEEPSVATTTPVPTTTAPTPPTTVPLEGAMPVYGVGQAAIGTDGSMWTVTESAAVRWDLEAGTAVAFARTDDLPLDAPRLLNEWRQGIGPVAVGSDETLWIAVGMDQLLRYDGPVEASIALPRDMYASPWANALAVAGDGTLWAAPNLEAYVFAYDGAEWAVFDESDGVPAVPSSIAVAPDGTVWVGSSGVYGDPAGNVLPTGVATFDGTSWTQFTTTDGLLSNDASVAIGSDGTVWLLHHGLSSDSAENLGVDPMPEGLSRFDGDSWTTYPDIAVSSDAVAGTDGTLWMAFGDSLVGFDGTDTTRIDVPLDSVDAAADSAAAQATAARQDGEPFDPAVHDLCHWFSTQEIDKIVTDSYLAHGAEPPPGTFATDGADPVPVGCTWYSEVDGVRLYGEDDGALLALRFRSADHPDILVLDEQPHEFVDYSPDGRVRIGNLSQGLWSYIQGVHASFTIEEHDEVIDYVHWAPHYDQQPWDSINPIGLAIADEMLRRIGWVPDN